MGFVDYSFKGDTSAPCRDVVKIKRRDEWDTDIGVRGYGYGGLSRYDKRSGKTEQQCFIEECQRMNLEWIEP